MGARGSRGSGVIEGHAAGGRELFACALAEGAEGVIGGKFDSRVISPTVLANVSREATVMQEEIFGPVLPMLTYKSLDEAIHFINEREKPLVSYLFSRDRRVKREFLSRTTAGATVINHTL